MNTVQNNFFYFLRRFYKSVSMPVILKIFKSSFHNVTFNFVKNIVKISYISHHQRFKGIIGRETINCNLQGNSATVFEFYAKIQ